MKVAQYSNIMRTICTTVTGESLHYDHHFSREFGSFLVEVFVNMFDLPISNPETPKRSQFFRYIR